MAGGEGVEREEAIRGLEHELGRLLRRVRRGLADRAVLVDPALSATAYPLLVTLAEIGPHRAAELAEMFALDKGAVSRIVGQLIELGLIERSPDPADGRASILRATDEAHRRLARLAEVRRAEVDVRLSAWDPSSITELADGLARFNAAISD
ncbi:MAG: MarR family winged helix-turn-helix transcriptional regulator [Marmoricola sp.]